VNPHLTYEEVRRKVDKINRRSYDYEQPFFNAVDDILDKSEGKHVTSVLTESLEKLLAQVNTEIDAIEKEIDVTPTCQAGCAHCCYFPIIVTRLEVKLMLLYIEQLPKERKRAVLDQIGTYLKKYSSNLEGIKNLDFERDQDFKRQYKQLTLPCVFLNLKTNKCMAYEVRPIPCRTYTNYADVSVCSNELIPKEPVSYEFLHHFYVQGMDEIIQEVLEVVEDRELGFSYPADAADVNYLPILLKEEMEV
jgi:Fe-S-cluster containining protein